MMNRILPVLFLLIVITIASSCRKAKEDKLEDMWKLIKVSETEYTDVFEIWDFEDGNLTRMVRNDTLALLDTVDVCKYKLLWKPGNTRIQVNDCSDVIYNSDWKVMKLRSTMMVILNNRDNMFLYREFEKYQ